MINTFIARTVLALILVSTVACNNDSTVDNSVNNSSSTPNFSTQPVDSGWLKSDKRLSPSEFSTSSEYKYEYRTGSSGDYEYNYDVNGSDDNGNSVDGNIDIRGKYGSGTITTEDGEEKDIDVEWVGYGQLKATDDEGNSYDLEVE